MNARAELLARLRAGWRGLPDKPGETPEATLAALAAHAEGAALRDLVERRLAGEPLAYLVGHVEFCGHRFLCGPGVMIPRRETELLVQAAAQVAPERARILDVCAGAGAVGLSLLLQGPLRTLAGADLAPEAVAWARRNAVALGLAGRAEFRQGDFLEPFRDPFSRFDLITCNPPYLARAGLARLPEEIRAHEPEAAFDGGPFGLTLLLRLVKEAAGLLAPGGWVVCETGLGQAEAVADRFGRAGYGQVRTWADAAGDLRVVAASVKDWNCQIPSVDAQSLVN